MSDWQEWASVQPGAPEQPVPKAPPPRGLFEQLIFLNATPLPVENVRYWLRADDGAWWEYEGSGVPPHEGEVDDRPEEGVFARAIRMEIQTYGPPVYMSDFEVERGWHIFRVWAGLGGRDEGGAWCGLLLRPDHSELEEGGPMRVVVVPSWHWSS